MHTLLGDRPDLGAIPIGPSKRQQAEQAARDEAAKPKPEHGGWFGTAPKGFRVINGRIETDMTPPVGKPPESDVPKVTKASLPVGQWIEHDGSGLPDIPHSARVEVRWGDDDTAQSVFDEAMCWGGWRWQGCKRAYRLVAYRIASLDALGA